jgi:hypothetical protein
MTGNLLQDVNILLKKVNKERSLRNNQVYYSSSEESSATEKSGLKGADKLLKVISSRCD